MPVPCEAGAVDVVGLTADSRAVEHGFLFAALQGQSTDGAQFIGDAVERGAVAVLAGRSTKIDSTADTIVIRADDPRKALALMAARFYPRQPEKLVAVTGTSGKTSVAAFTQQIFEAAGTSSASIGTLGVVSRSWTETGSLTTPDPVTLHQILDRLAGAGVTHAALEASSHGLDQRRLDGLRLVAAGFTNLGRDHLDYHATVADYLAAKLRLFTDILPPDGTAVIEMDDLHSAQVAATARERGQSVIGVGRRGNELHLDDISPEGSGQRLTLEVFGKPYSVRLPLAGGFQVSNALVAAGLAIGAGVDPEVALAALEDLVGAPGRLEFIGRKADGGMIFVDYAHKPDAVESVLKALRPLTQGRLIIVLGAGGDRDIGKRRLMGEAAARYADVIVVTDDNPRSEDPADIRRAIIAGASNSIEIPDRAAAIREAVAMLGPGDVLCVAGKGHETGQIVGDRRLPFSDHAEIKRVLEDKVGA